MLHRLAENLLPINGTGTVFDVSRKTDVYGPGKAYNIFAGKDGSRGLGMSSLKTEDAVPDWSVLEEKDKKTLDDWYTFFECVPFPFSKTPVVLATLGLIRFLAF